MQLWRFTRKIHTSWLIALASAGVVVGVAAAAHVEQGWFASVGWMAVGVMMVVIALWRRMVMMVPLAIIGGLVIGLWRGSVMQAQLSVYENLVNSTVQVVGVVGDDPDIGKKDEVLLRLEKLSIDNHQVSGKVWVSTYDSVDIKRGDIVKVKGKLVPGFGSFAAAMYRVDVEMIQRPQPGDVARQARDWFADKVRLAIHEPQASLGLGYLLGQRRALPPELDQALVVAGLTHIVVASGYNLTILVRFARRAFVKISKYLAALSATAMIVAFIAITGASPSMSRAGLVAGLSLAAWYYGRRFHPLVLLPFAAAVTVLVNPTYAWNDLGWQLSFAAFAGVMILAPLLQRYFYGDTKPGALRQILGETISAQIMTLPIIVLAFGAVSNVAVIANLLILPLVPLAMLLTFVAGLGGMLMPQFSGVIGVPAEVVLSYMTMVAHYFANLSWAQTTVQLSVGMVIAAYILIIGICIYLQRVTKYDLRDTNIIE